MPIGYLFTSAVIAVCTLLAVAPRPVRWLGVVCFRGGLPAAELPFAVGAYLLASTVLVLVQGGAGTPVGVVALALAAGSAAGLGLIVQRMAGAPQTVALEVGTAMTEPRAPGRRPRVRPGVLLAPLPVGRGDVERISDIPYGDAGERHLLDLYRSRSGETDGPTLLHLHGGRFVSGRKSREALPLLHRLAQRGWVCASANYRLGPDAYADQLADAKRAIAWLRDEGRGHGAGPVVLVAGSSAGAHLAATAALTANDPAVQPGFEQADTSVDAAICLHGYYGPAGTDRWSPVERAGAHAPPFFIAHGDVDTLVRVEGARRFAEALRERSHAPVAYAELRGAQHGFDLFDSIRLEGVIDGVSMFAASIRARHV